MAGPRKMGDSVRDLPNPYWQRTCCEGESTVFRVRKGPDYKKHGQKSPSGPTFFDCVGVDVFKCAKKQSHLCRYIKLPDLPAAQQGPVAGVPPYFVINCQLPGYDPPNPLWGSHVSDGPGYSVVAYLLLKPETRQALQEGVDTPALRLLKRFIEHNEERVRFKAMVNTLNTPDLDIGYTLRKLMTEYNMKPILTRPQHQFYTDHVNYFEVDLDVHLFGYVARKGLSMLRPTLESVILDVGFTIEGWTDEELPENILSCVHIHFINLDGGEEIDFTGHPEVKQQTPH